MNKPALSFVRTTLETMLIGSMLEPALRGAGPVGELEAQAFAAEIAKGLEARSHDER